MGDPDIVFIDCMMFITPDIGGLLQQQAWTERTSWCSNRHEGGTGRVPNDSSRIKSQMIRDLFFFDQQTGWLTTWNSNGEGTDLFSTADGGKHWTPDSDLSFHGKDKQANIVRFTSRERGFVFFLEGAQNRLAYTTDGGRHWHKQALPRFVYDCQIFAGDLMCSAQPGFRLLALHPK